MTHVTISGSNNSDNEYDGNRITILQKPVPMTDSISNRFNKVTQVTINGRNNSDIEYDGNEIIFTEFMTQMNSNRGSGFMKTEIKAKGKLAATVMVTRNEIRRLERVSIGMAVKTIRSKNRKEDEV